jgi:hypothetical protein
MPGVEATTAYAPAFVLAVAVTLAWPEELVTAVVAPRTALAPLPGGAKVTVTPETGLPLASDTVATSGAANAVETTAD